MNIDRHLYFCCFPSLFDIHIFLFSGEENQFRDRFGNLAFDIKAADIADKAKYPNYCRENDQRLEIIQEQGQIIFVPSGWHHQVYNLVRLMKHFNKLLAA